MKILLTITTIAFGVSAVLLLIKIRKMDAPSKIPGYRFRGDPTAPKIYKQVFYALVLSFLISLVSLIYYATKSDSIPVEPEPIVEVEPIQEEPTPKPSPDVEPDPNLESPEWEKELLEGLEKPSKKYFERLFSTISKQEEKEEDSCYDLINESEWNGWKVERNIARYGGKPTTERITIEKFLNILTILDKKTIETTQVKEVRLNHKVVVVSQETN